MRGVSRDDVLEGLRILPIAKRAVAAFTIDHQRREVLILGVFTGGQDYVAVLKLH